MPGLECHFVEPISQADLDTIVGAFREPDIALFRLLLRETASCLGGDLAEMGVFYGASAVVIGEQVGPDDTFTVVDLFGEPADSADNQRELDGSYPGLTRAAFEANYVRFHPQLPVVVQGLSTSIADYATSGTHRFVHIDASHLYEHVAADLEVAQKLLKTDGVVVLDDYRSEHTPGVAAAAWRATAHGLKPFAVSPHKMYATWGDPDLWAPAVEHWAADSDLLAETQSIDGQPVLRISSPRLDPPHPMKRYFPEVTWPALSWINKRTSGRP